MSSIVIEKNIIINSNLGSAWHATDVVFVVIVVVVVVVVVDVGNGVADRVEPQDDEGHQVVGVEAVATVSIFSIVIWNQVFLHYKKTLKAVTCLAYVFSFLQMFRYIIIPIKQIFFLLNLK